MTTDISWIRGANYEFSVQAVVVEEGEAPRLAMAGQGTPDGWVIYRRLRGAEVEGRPLLESHGVYRDETQALLNASALALEEYHVQEASPEEEDDEHPHDERFRQVAAEMYEEEGSLEIDANAPVSRGDDPGAYVQAWVWVAYSDIPDLEFDDAEDDAA